ncbi:MAG TPA: hypothetical protein VGQ57_06195 [Polyangiaceae bacterium]|jgi:hypothetical protein|nr:hypothetical protein [Polyangiaceae bacterium]
MSRSISRLGALFMASIAVACGGEAKHPSDAPAHDVPDGGAGKGADAGAPVPRDCPDPSSDDPALVIDDMEDGDAYILAAAGRYGGWWTDGDATTGASMVPAQWSLSNRLAAPELLPEPRCGSLHAMHVTGQGFTDWGAVLGADLVEGTTPNGDSRVLPYDASAYQGVEFYARIGDTSIGTLRYQVSDVNSQPEGGRCTLNGGTSDGCYDSFGVAINLDTTWRHYKIPFSGLSQQNFGLPADGVVSNAVYQITFDFPASSVFDFWMDDLKFY